VPPNRPAAPSSRVAGSTLKMTLDGANRLSRLGSDSQATLVYVATLARLSLAPASLSGNPLTSISASRPYAAFQSSPKVPRFCKDMSVYWFACLGTTSSLITSLCSHTQALRAEMDMAGKKTPVQPA